VVAADEEEEEGKEEDEDASKKYAPGGMSLETVQVHVSGARFVSSIVA
jgi:hypothetical protein